MGILDALERVVTAIRTWVDDNKVQKIDGKVLSSNDYTTTDKEKVDNMANDLVIVDNKLYLAKDGDPIDGTDVVLPAFDNEPEDGVTFIPSVSDDGVISWENNGGLENPRPVNIKGDTPVRGVDYWTEEDQSTIQSNSESFISEELAKRGQLKPEFANSIDECVDTNLLYVLPDGYIYAYGLIIKDVPNFTNFADMDSSEWLENRRVNSSGQTSEADGTCVTNFIECKVDDVVRIKGVTNPVDYNGAFSYHVSTNYAGNTYYPKSDTSGSYHYDASNSMITVKVGRYTSSSGVVSDSTNMTVARFTVMPIDTIEDIVITVNEEITYTHQSEREWSNTGHAFVSAEKVDGNIHIDINTNLEFVDSVNLCTDASKAYVLPDGSVYAYMKKEVVSEALDKTTKSDPSSELDKRLNSSGLVTNDNGSVGVYTTNLIPIGYSLSEYDNFVVRVNGFHNADTQQVYYNGVALYDENNNKLVRACLVPLSWSVGTADKCVLSSEDSGEYYFDICHISAANPNVSPSKLSDSILSKVKYMRIAFNVSSGTSLGNVYPEITVTFDEDAKPHAIEDWMDTGHKFVPADYDNDIVDLQDRVTSAEVDIAILDSLVSELNSNSDVIAIPSYWKSAVDTAINSVREHQNAGGKDVVSFVWFSDPHHYIGSNYTKNLGALTDKVMAECGIPVCLVTGDLMNADSVAEKSTLTSYVRSAIDVLGNKPNRCYEKGNHDDVWGEYATGATFRNKLSANETYNLIGRPQIADMQRVFGDEGIYFYVDNHPQKVRFVCLDSQYYGGEEVIGTTDSNATGKMTFGFGDQQLAWLENVALNTNYHIVISFHCPPVNGLENVNGINNYLSALDTIKSDGVNGDGTRFRKIVSEKDDNGQFKHKKILGIFCGHCHIDKIIKESELPCPVITITSAGENPYDGTKTERIAGTNKETALDIVNINKTTGDIDIVRLGSGSNRKYVKT